MSTVPSTTTLTPGDPEHVWDVATLYPEQGQWSEEEYLRLTDWSNRLIEFTDGSVEFLAMPTEVHQLILMYLMDRLRSFVEPRELGMVLFSGLRLRVRPSKIREPDLIFISKERYSLRGNRYWSGADLVMEIVSADETSQVRDYEQKVLDYSEGNVAEYWIVDPQSEKVSVLTLSDGVYAVAGEYGPGATAKSIRLPGFEVDVNAVFAAAKR